jgi:hypothetical protein
MNPETEVTFTHRQFAHCESGVSSQLVQHAGFPLSEAMVFGIGSGIFFAHLPFVKIMGLPLTSYRAMPSTIFKKCMKRLRLNYQCKTFSNASEGQSYLDSLLEKNKIVALQTNIFWLPYVPERFRFPFNAHNLIVYGKEKSGEGNYLVSDPVLDFATLCPTEAMNKARFAKGVLAPKGFLYYIDQRNLKISDDQLRAAVHQGIKESTRRMLFTPIPFFGLRAIRYLSKRIGIWFRKNEPRRFSLLLTHVIRMQEEIGTGGAGFRFLFAKFLEESAKLYPGAKGEVLRKGSREFLVIGDSWRQWAVQAVKICKHKEELHSADIQRLSDELHEIYVSESAAFKDLHDKFVRG